MLHGRSPATLMAMFQALEDHENMRRTTDGTPVSARQRRLFESSMMNRFDLSPVQYGCVSAIFDRYGGSDAVAGLRHEPPPAPPGQPPHFVRRCFAADRTYCCGIPCRVRLIMATYHSREGSFPSWSVVKECQRGCGTTYYADSMTLRGVVGGVQSTIHVFPPWTEGTPSFIMSKSGKSIICTDYLTDLAIGMCKQAQV